MATQHQMWIKIEECIYDYIEEAELPPQKFVKLYHLAFRGMEALGLDAFYRIKSIVIPLNDNQTATLPSDFINYSKVGVFNSKGEVITMGVNDKLSVAFDLSPDRIERVEDNTILNFTTQQGIWWYNYWDGRSYGNLYGLPSGAPFIGSFKIDSSNGVIVLSPDFTYDYVVLEYVCSPVQGGDYYIPIQFREALIAYLRWKDIISIPVKTHVQNSNVVMRRKDFYNEREKAIARYDPVRLPDLYEWHLQNQRMVVKS